MDTKLNIMIFITILFFSFGISITILAIAKFLFPNFLLKFILDEKQFASLTTIITQNEEIRYVIADIISSHDNKEEMENEIFKLKSENMKLKRMNRQLQEK